MFGLPGVFRVVRCHGCGQLYLRDRPACVGAYYPENYYAYQRDNHVGRSCWHRVRRVLAWPIRVLRRHNDGDIRLSALAPVGAILDVGCGSGTALDWYKSRGWKTHGLDISRRAIELCRARGHEGYCCEIENLPGKHLFDAIRASHVLEHLPNPITAMAAFSRLLKPGGFCLIMVPNHGSALARLFGRWYWQIDAPRHFFHFKLDDLRRLADAAGLSCVWAGTRSLGRGVLYCIAFAFGDLLGQKVVLQKVPRWLAVSADALFAPLCLLLDLLGFGDNLVFLAHKAEQSRPN